MTGRRRILFITIDVPRDSGSGGQIVSWRLLNAYSTFSDVDVLALSSPEVGLDDSLGQIATRVVVVPVQGFYFADARLRTIARFARAQLFGPPFRVGKFASDCLATLIKQWSAETKYDLVHFDHLSTAQYRCHVPDVAAILMEHNVEWEMFERLAQDERGFRSILLKREAQRTERYEAEALANFQRVLTLSDRDRRLLAAIRPDVASYVSVWPLPVSAPPRAHANSDEHRIVILGSLRSIGRLRGLRWFLREIWPEVRSVRPEAELDVIGAEPPLDVLAYDGIDGVTVHGFVANVEPLVARAEVCAIPLFVGGGIRVKVLEMLARGIPCVGTSVGLQGLEDLPGCRVVKDTVDWVDALTGTALQRLRQAAAGSVTLLARERTSARSAELLQGIVESILDGGRRAAPDGPSVV